MDPLIDAAARLLAAGDVLGALSRVALLEEPSALALRGVALARLGDLPGAKELLERAVHALDDGAAKARCTVAIAEIAIAARELDISFAALDAARDTLIAHGDAVNAAYADLVAVRACVLLGDLDEASRRLATHHYDVAPATLVAVRHLLTAEVAVRRIEASAAAESFARAARAADLSGIDSLRAEVARAAATLDATAARIVDGGERRALVLAEVEATVGGPDIVVDACRRRILCGRTVIDLARKGTLFELLRALALAGPEGHPREALMHAAFGVRRSNESQRARLRVDMSRLRKAIAALASVEATPLGFTLRAKGTERIVVLLPPIDGAHGDVLALLADGQRWSTSALATATGTSRRTVQRALGTLESEGRVQAFGRGPARRWLAAPLTSIATALLLPIVPPRA